MMKAIPTRLSVYDLRYDPEFARRLIISVDDIEQQHVLTYDVDEGTVVRYATDRVGNFVVNRDTDDLVTEEVRGEIVVILKPV